MSENVEQDVDTSSAKFKEGVEAALNSAEDTKNWKAGNELGQELKAEGETKEPAPFNEPSVPLFMKDSTEGDKGNAQDEKDESEE
ncbi:MAG TPA: hypothetical protein VJ124_01790 [Pyrinomonadaceae bacterium]|nr:hypothetical protein [Pyrinomonadaceae bacterium]